MPQITINVNGTNYTVGYDGTFYSPQGMLIALNNLGFGIFYIAVDGATNYLTTVDNTNVYGNITTFADPITMTTNASCSGAGFDGQGVIDVTQFVGGDGYYSYIAIGNTTGQASANVQNPLTRDEIFGLGAWQFQDLVNGTYYVAIMDNDGNIGISEGTNVSCLPIPNTTTTTTTTTTAAPTTSTTTTTTTAAPTTTTTTTTTTTSSTTTTTTAAPTTSTTTTTTTGSGPTTTSTTTTTTTLFAQTVTYANNATDACLNPTGSQNVTGNAVDFCSCTIFNSAGFVTLSNGNYVLAYGGNTLNVNISGAPTTTAIVYGGGCGVCPLSTTTTTTTTIPPQVWYTLTQCYSGTLTTSTNYNSGTFQIGDIVTYSDTIYFTVSGVNFTDPGGIHWSITATAYLSCPSTTTTTTTTTLPPLTLSTTPSCYGSGLPGQGQILANNFAGGSGTYSYLAIGTSEASAFICIGNPACRVNITGETSHTFSSLANGDYWVVIQDSVGAQNISAKNTVSCNATTTTSTTTTLAPVTFDLTPSCLGAGIPGTGSIYINNFAGGNGVYDSIGFATTLQDAIANVIPLNGATNYTWFGLSNITYFVVLRDSLGDFGYNYTTIACNATTTTTTTTTTLPPITVSLANSCGSPAIPGSGRVDATSYAGGTGSYTFIAIGSSEANAIACVNNPSCTDRKTAGSSAFWTSLANGNYWVALKDSVGAIGLNGPTTVACNATTTTTTTSTTSTSTTITTSTTTTTTTLAITFTRTPSCGTPAIPGSGIITINGFSGGNGNYTSTGIGLNLTDAINSVISLGGASSYTWYGQANNTYYIVLRDSTGAYGYGTVVVSCTATTSTTTTTTTLPAISATLTPTCDGTGIPGTGRVTASSYTGGSGSYTFIALGTSEANAISCLNNAGCADRKSAGSSQNWTNLGNGNFWVALRDSVGGTGVIGPVSVACNATTTTTSTTTTTCTPNGTFLYQTCIGFDLYNVYANGLCGTYNVLVQANSPACGYTTTTSTTSTTTTIAPTYSWLVNSAAGSASAACSSSPSQYVWTFGNAFGAGITFYAGDGVAPYQPIQPFLGGGYYYANGGYVVNIDDNGNSSNYQPCPTTSTTTQLYSIYTDCVGNYWWTDPSNTGNGQSNDVPDLCVFYVGQSTTTQGSYFSNFFNSDCPCP